MTRFDDLAAKIGERVGGYRRTGDARVLFADEVQAEVADLLEATEPADPENLAADERKRIATTRHLLGTLFFLRFDSAAAGRLTDLAHALAFHWPADVPAIGETPDLLRALLPGTDADVVSQVGAAVALFQHAMSGDEPDSLRMTIALFEDVVAATPPRHREFPLRLGYLVGANLIAYRMTGDLRAADEAIELARRGLDVLPRRHPDRSWFLSAVASARVARVRNGSLGDLRDAIETGEQALRSRERRTRLRFQKRRPSAHPFLDELADLAYSYELSPFRAQLQQELAYAYEFRYRVGGAPADLDRAIALREQAIAESGRSVPGLLSGIVNGYLSRFDRTGEAADLRRALAAAERLLDVAGPGDPDRELAAALATVARSAHGWEKPGEGGFLKRLWLALASGDGKVNQDALITLGETALTATGIQIALDETITGLPDADDPATDRTLIQLADSYAGRFFSSGHKPDIDRAVALIELMKSLDHGHDLVRAGWVYRTRYSASGSAADLEIAISHYEKALQAMDRGDPEYLRGVHELGNAYRAAAMLTGGEEFLRRGAELSRQALADTPADDPARALLTAAVADTHYLRSRSSGDIEELNHAIDLYRQVAASDNPRVLSRLGVAYRSRFGLLGDPSDLRLAIETYGEALTHTSDDALKAFCVANIGLAWRELSDAAPEAVSADDLEALVRTCDAPPPGLPIHRALAQHAAGSLALAMNQPRTAVRLLDRAVEELRTVAWREIEWEDQETHLGGTGDLAGEAVAAHLAIGDPAGAVEVAERGRALILGSELDIRADVAGLAGMHPPLAELLSEVRERLNTPMVIDLLGASHDNVGRSNRTLLWAEHDRLVGQIRLLPGFAGFLQPPSLAELRPAAEGGAVVLVNATTHRSEAVIVTADADPIPVALPRVTIADLRAHVDAHLDAMSAPPLTRALRAPRVLTGVLAWLWESTVEPILAALPRQESRVWWLPTGLFGLLPLHAAGLPGQPGALDLVTSSYVPTLRALRDARQRASTAAREQLTVAMEHTPGFPRLPGTAAEAAALHAQHPGHPLLADADATARNVQTALAECTWAHFACHAGADPATSARAVLHLHGSELAVETISRMRLDTAELAYLSACSTAARGARSDEPVNLAAAFQLAGFRHVVASLWPLPDTVAPHAAQSFYRTLGDSVTAGDGAHAVRAVARELRAGHPGRPDIWAALVHSGP